MLSPLRPALLTLSLAIASCSEGLPTGHDRANTAPAKASYTIQAAAPAPSVTCTVTDNANETFAGVAFWSDVTVWTLRFYNATYSFSADLPRPYRAGSGGYSALTFAPTSVDLVGRTGETLATAACSGLTP